MSEDIKPVTVERGRLTEDGPVVAALDTNVRRLVETRDVMRGWLERWLERVFGGGPR